MIPFLIRLYPAPWRERYGDEFAAILEERPLGPFDVADIVLGALDARLRRRDRSALIDTRRRPSMSLRIGGLAAIIGPVIVLLVALTGGLTPDATKDAKDAAGLGLLVGLGLLLVAVTGLSAFQARSEPRLIWGAFAVTAAGTIAMLATGAADLRADSAQAWTPILLTVGGAAAAVGSALFGLATRRVSVLSRKGASSLVAGPILVAVGLAAATLSWELGFVFVMAGLVTMLAGWVTLGVAALRLERPAAAALNA